MLVYVRMLFKLLFQLDSYSATAVGRKALVKVTVVEQRTAGGNGKSLPRASLVLSNAFTFTLSASTALFRTLAD